MDRFEPWNYRETSGVTTGADLVGFKVEATDGSIGKIDEHTHEVGASYLVVDTGPWIFGTKVMLPAGTISRVDPAEQRVHVDLTKDQIKAAPEFDPNTYTDATYRDKVGGYYGDTYGYPPSGPGAGNVPPPSPLP